MDVALVTADRATFAAIGLPPEHDAAIDRPLHDELVRRGHTVHRVPWRDEVDWSRFDLALVRTPWDYTADRERFVDWARRVASATSLWNPADVLRWNTHKGYLLELEERGAPVVATAWLAEGDRVDLAALVAGRGWGRVVCKPAVGSGSDGLLLLDPALEPAAAQRGLERLAAAGDAMVQPYLASVETHGEVSVVLVDGAVTHAVAKRPPPGEHRVQETFGGTYERLSTDGAGAEPAALARWVVEATGHEVLYARVDLLRADDGTWQLAELELTEPDLYLSLAPEAAVAVVDALERRA